MNSRLPITQTEALVIQPSSETLSSNNFKANQFRAHGRIECRVYTDRVISCKAFGPFNKELATALEQMEENAFMDYKRNWPSWAYVIEFVGDCLMTLEAAQVFQNMLQDLKRTGLAPIASALVFHEHTQSKLIGKRVYRQIHDVAGIKSANFESYSEGLHWAQQQLE